MLIIFFWLNTTDLAWAPAFQSINQCFPEEKYISIFNKAIWSIGIVGSTSLALRTKPHLLFTETMPIVFSFFAGCFGAALLIIGPSIEGADGMGAVSANIFCGSAPGAIIMLTAVGIGAFSNLLLFLYTCKSIFLLKR